MKITSKTNISVLIQEMEKRVPPEKRSAGVFLVIADVVEGNLQDLDEQILAKLRDRFGFDDQLIAGGPYGKILFHTILLPELARGLADIHNQIAEAREYLSMVRPILESLPSDSAPPPESWPLFYRVSGMTQLQTPIYVLPAMLGNQADALIGGIDVTMKSFFPLIVESATNAAEQVAEGAATILKESAEAAGNILGAGAKGLVQGLGIANLAIVAALTVGGVMLYQNLTKKKSSP